MTPFISVVVCTYNREDLITGCLDSLADQTADSSSFEVLVIDNNSTDNTNHLVRNYSRLSNLRLISEPMQGLSHARNRGLQEAEGDYVAYLDDDARAESHYIQNILKLLGQFSDTVDCYGGPILPFYTTEKPAWFKDEYETMHLHKTTGFQKFGKTFSGSNMIWRKSLLVELGGFNPEFGMSGEKMILGEETHLFNKLWSTQKPRLYYSSDLLVYHWVPPEKMTVRYRLKRAYASGNYYGVELSLNDEKNLRVIIFHFFCLLKAIIRAIAKLLRFQNFPNWSIEYLSPIACQFGIIINLLKN